MRTTPFPFRGQTFHLLLNAAALFAIYDRLGDTDSVARHITGNSKAAFENTCFYLAVLAEQGELLRRHMGYDREPIPSEELFRVGLRPLEAATAKGAILEAIAAGFAREAAAEPKETDLGLLELQKKTAAGSPGQNF